MAQKTAAQEEFDDLISKNSQGDKETSHPDDKEDYSHDRVDSDKEEEESYRQTRIEDNMKMPMGDRSNGVASTLLSPFGGFDTGSRTGVKGVIADARAFEAAKRSGGWMKGKRDSILGWGNVKIDKENKRMSVGNFGDMKETGDGSGSDSEEFFERWRQQRRMELETESTNIRNRRTSPSMRRFGRFDEVDALGYLDAIEKVTQETVVIVFVYDPECPVSQVISDALKPLVFKYPMKHFVSIHYEEIEFDNAGVPAVLAYKNCGDLFANLTYIIDQIPDNTQFDTGALETILKKNEVL